MIAEDWDLLQLMDANPEVMATLGGVRPPEESRAYAARQADHWKDHGFGWWAILDRASNEFIGRGGLRHIEIEGRAEIEIGYALLPSHWGRGLATELARTAKDIGVDELQLDRIVGVVLPTNHASRRVLEKADLRTCAMVMSRTSAASRPARRMASNSSAPCNLINPVLRSGASVAAT